MLVTASVLLLPMGASAEQATVAPVADESSTPTDLIERTRPANDGKATVRYCETPDMQRGNSYIYLWPVGKKYTAEMWFSRNFDGTACLTNFGDRGFRIDWDLKTYGFLHEVGLYNLSIPVDSISGNPKARHRHRLSNITGGGGYTGLYGWFGKAGTPDSIELYINENWAGGDFGMGDTIKMGSIEVDGGVYDIYTRPRRGNRFVQWWSNRRTPRESGTISYKKHFDAWRKLGMPNAALTRLTFALEARWGVKTGGSVHYKSFHIDTPGGSTR
ncbi:glycoside hydrolase family 11 protein [Sandaracinobacteroides saxicola]|uniref:endo-1,4-beta-xylanase n=1 Tax=Sandaracinobacteroides saxicola TaxID=2759707 RepID=A0A7G5IM50_9SPHN|nr:glycoside hydrolase family 11 protein [Sandaracinobacteroides saxicola]QMW24442.1 glycoside hydrolase family 11 protein [Sandaracinobacteroides saxicola]